MNAIANFEKIGRRERLIPLADYRRTINRGP